MRNFLIFTLILFFLKSISCFSQDYLVNLNGEKIICKIVNIEDYILYAKIGDNPYLETFFSDEISSIAFDHSNNFGLRSFIKSWKKTKKELSDDEKNNNYFFGIPYSIESIEINNIIMKDSSNLKLLPYDPLDKGLHERLNSVKKSLLKK